MSLTCWIFVHSWKLHATENIMWLQCRFCGEQKEVPQEKEDIAHQCMRDGDFEKEVVWE